MEEKFVLRRVRIKLEGREPDALRKVGLQRYSLIVVDRMNNVYSCQASIGEQVDFLIRESLNQENLALMYEGWTAWI